MTRASTSLLIVLLLTGNPSLGQDQELDPGRSESEQKVLFFDGIDDFVKAPFLDFSKFTEGFTVEMWHMNWSGYILSQGAVGDPENSVWLSTGHLFFGGCGWEDNERDPSRNFAQYAGLSKPREWTHLALVFDGKKQSIFVDGQLMGERLFPAPGSLLIKRDLIIGAEPDYDEGDTWTFGSGFLRALRVSSVVRYNSNFKPAIAFKSDDDTVVLFSSTAVKGDRLVDLSGNGQHGELHGPGLLSPDSITTRVLEGSVFDPDGNPANGIIVLLQNKDKVIAITRATDSGRFRFALNNPKGDYSLEAGDWTRTVADRWASTLEGKVEGINVDEGDRSQVDVKLEDTTPQAESSGEEAFKSYMEFAVGGSWSTTSSNSDTIEHTYEWEANNNFVRLNSKGGLIPFVAMIGIDPKTKKFTWWFYNEDGSIGKDIMTQKGEDTWILQGHGTGDKGGIHYKGEITRVDENTIEELVIKHVVYGKKHEPSKFIWKRKR
jgi:concanavalin A-like lectin/glucanase superfamily protein